MALEDFILSTLKKTPADQYAIFRHARNAKMSDIAKSLAELQRKRSIHVIGYRKSLRTGFDIPIYSIRAVQKTTLDVHPLLAGVTSERNVEYEFVSQNLLSPKKRSKILDIGTGESGLAEAIREFGTGKLELVGVDLAQVKCDARMDARYLAFRNKAFDQVICISTIEHVGLIGSMDERGDRRVLQEISRILKERGTAIVSLPYGKNAQVKQDYRVYDRRSFSALSESLSIEKKEFYCYLSGKWVACSQAIEDEFSTKNIPSGFHSPVCACLLLRKGD